MRTMSKVKKYIHVCFAHPVLISWLLGAAFLDVIIILSLISEFSDTKALFNLRVAALLILVLIPATLLGYFCGMFTVWPFIRSLCVRLNGGPFKPRDRVLVLSGVHKWKEAFVSETTVGQGGWNLLYLSSLDEPSKQISGIFEEYSVLLCHHKDKASVG